MFSDYRFLGFRSCQFYVCVMLMQLLCIPCAWATNFGPAVDINNDVLFNVMSLPAISLNNIGTAIAVWGEQNNLSGINNIYSRTFNGTSWSPTINLNNASGQPADAPQIALNNTGTAIAVWQENNGSGTVNIYSRIFNGTSWSPTANLNDASGQDARLAQVALNNTGTAIAVWQEYNVSVYNIYSRIFDGADWSATTSLNNASDQYAQEPQIALNNAGTAIAVWSEDTNGSGIFNIYARTFDGTNWSATTSLNNAPDQYAYEQQIALNNAGTAIAVWSEDTNGGGLYNIYSRTFDGTSWSVTATDLNSDPDQVARTPQIALTNTGTAIAVWTEVNGGTNNRIYSRTFDGTSWSAATSLNNDPNQDAETPQIALNDNGTAIAVWREDNGSGHFNTYSRTFDGASWSTTVNDLNNDPNQGAVTPQIALNDNDAAITVWSEQNGSVFNIFARQTALPYYFSQWNSSMSGTKQYISAVRNSLSQSHVDIYEYDPSNNGIDYKVTITVDGTIHNVAVYNKSDTELYSAIITNTPDSLQIWQFNGSTITQTADLSSLVTMPINDAQWWVTSATQSYIATISDSALSILDLVNPANNSSLPTAGTKLLWTTKDDYTGVVVLNGTVATPYQIDLSTNPITISLGTAAQAPFGYFYQAISTCGDYIAVGLNGAAMQADAQLALLNLDTNTNTLTLSSTSATLSGQLEISSLARCCCCAIERPLLAGSLDQNRNYTVSIWAPDLSTKYVSTLLGNNVQSVAWSCQGENQFLSASSLEYNGFQYTVKYTFTSGSLSDQVVVTH